LTRQPLFAESAAVKHTVVYHLTLMDADHGREIAVYESPAPFHVPLIGQPFNTSDIAPHHRWVKGIQHVIGYAEPDQQLLRVRMILLLTQEEPLG
jgi:hypothetical protein